MNETSGSHYYNKFFGIPLLEVDIGPEECKILYNM